MEYSLQTVEEFMHRLFDGKIELEKQRQATDARFRPKFFTQDCDYGSRPGFLEARHSEKIQSINVLDSKAEVITKQIAFYHRPDASFEMRYLLRAEIESWLIYEIDVRCCSCDEKSPTADCPCCRGTGWRNTKSQKSCAT
jgi:hypothetical protein